MIDAQIAVIVTTYNRPDALEAVLIALGEQTDSFFEVIVADDGSTASTRTLVERFAKVLPLPVKYVWHEDRGFRAAAIRNLGILATKAPYLIFLDGDCVPRSDFIFRHRQLGQKGRLVTGSRVLMSEFLTRQVLQTGRAIHRFSTATWFAYRLFGDVNKWLPLAVTLPPGCWREPRGFKWRRIKSCNLAVWRSDVVAVGGFDESFEGWGHEDADFVLRLHHFGIERTQGNFATEVFHLWHKEAKRDSEERNLKRVLERIERRQIEAKVGITSLGSVSVTQKVILEREK